MLRRDYKVKVVDAINESITHYPSLYLKNTWEESRFDVLHHYFIILGAGVKWAYTKDPKAGGYLTTGGHYKKNGEWVRKYDLPYGKEKFPLDSRFFKEPYCELYGLDKKIDFMLCPDLQSEKKGCFLSEIPDNYVPAYGKHKRPSKIAGVYTTYPDNDRVGMLGPQPKHRHPYPNFQKKYSIFWEPGAEYIQDDWREAAIEHLQFWLDYFNDPSRYNEPGQQNSHYAVDANRVKSQKVYIEQKYKNAVGDNWIKEVQTGYDFPGFNGSNYRELVENSANKAVKEAKSFLAATLKKLKKG